METVSDSKGCVKLLNFGAFCTKQYITQKQFAQGGTARCGRAQALNHLRIHVVRSWRGHERNSE